MCFLLMLMCILLMLMCFFGCCCCSVSCFLWISIVFRVSWVFGYPWNIFGTYYLPICSASYFSWLVFQLPNRRTNFAYQRYWEAIGAPTSLSLATQNGKFNGFMARNPDLKYGLDGMRPLWEYSTSLHFRANDFELLYPGCWMTKSDWHFLVLRGLTCWLVKDIRLKSMVVEWWDHEGKLGQTGLSWYALLSMILEKQFWEHLFSPNSVATLKGLLR